MRLIKRTVAFFIDYIIFITPASIILMYLEIHGLLNIHIVLFIFAITYSFIICRDIVGGQSIGKKILNLKVINEDTKKPADPWQHIIRSLFIPIWILELVMLGINSRQRVGDYVAHTSVKSCSREWKNGAKLSIQHFAVFIIVATMLYLIFLLLFLNTKAFRLYYGY